MRPLVTLVLLVLLLPCLSPDARADAQVDWATGRLSVRAAAAADLRLPSADIARVAAERAARARARAELTAAARALPWAGGGTLGAHADADAAAGRALNAALEALVVEETRLQSDGSVVLRAQVSLDALAGLPAAAAPPSVVLDGRAQGVRPQLGYRLSGGATVYAGPVRFANASERPVGAAVTRVAGAELAVPDAALARAAGPVLILVGGAP
jgi:hypothetical protein